MKMECIQFWPTREGISVNAVKQSLPIRLQEELLDAWGIQLEASKSNEVDEIEEILQIGKTKEFVKYRYLEVDKHEIHNYSHFLIRPQRFGWQEDVFFDVTERTCKSHDGCPWGVEISSPLGIKANKLCGIGEVVGPPMLKTKLVLVAEHVKQLFDSEGITGLEYMEGEDLDLVSRPFVARVAHGAYEAGTDLVTNCCPKHRSISGALIFDATIPRNGIVDQDFQMIDRVRIEEQEFFYHHSLLVVSRRALELLFRHKVPGLEKATTILSQKFRPLVVS